MLRRSELAATVVVCLAATLAVWTARRNDRGSVRHDAIATAFATTRARGVHVVDATAIEQWFRPAGRPPWTFDGVPRDSSHGQPLAFGASPAVVVVFVHGYNTSPDEALRYGTNLKALIDRAAEPASDSRPRLPGGHRLRFVTFVWRGDFGRLRFARSQRAAERAAPVLREVLTGIRQQAPAATIVLVAHSLGSYVSLEAVRAMNPAERASLVNALVLVQGAVPAYSLMTWSVDGNVQILPQAPVLPDPIHYTNDCEGRYVEAAAQLRYVLYTFSKHDEILADTKTLLVQPTGGYFGVAQRVNPLQTTCEVPLVHRSVDIVPIGSPFERKTYTEYVSTRPAAPSRPVDVDPTRPGVPSSPTVARIDSAFWATYDHWQLAAGTEALELPLRRPSGLRSFHSPVFDETSAESGDIVAAIWDRVSAGLLK